MNTNSHTYAYTLETLRYKYVSHVMHFIVMLLTLGLWGPIWLLIFLHAINHNKKVDVACKIREFTLLEDIAKGVHGVNVVNTLDTHAYRHTQADVTGVAP